MSETLKVAETGKLLKNREDKNTCRFCFKKIMFEKNETQMVKIEIQNHLQ